MKKTLTVLLLAVLTLSLLLCGCDQLSFKKEENPIIKKVEIREDANFVTVVYEDGYELTYALTQPIETFVEEDNTRSARAVGMSLIYFTSTDKTTIIFGGGEKGDYSATVDNSGNYIISGDAFVGNVSASGLQVQVGLNTGSFKQSGKVYEDCSTELLTIFRQKTTLIDFATGFEATPYDNISAFSFEKFENLEAIILPTSIKTVGKKAFDNCPKLTTVYYFGTEAEWQNVELVCVEDKTIDDDKNETVEIIENALTSCTVYFYSENEPTSAGNYWHLVDGKPTAW
jgi:hypothetical protein